MWSARNEVARPYRSEVIEPTDPTLRQCVLAVCVLDDIDLIPSDDGVLLATDRGSVDVSYHDILAALGQAAPETPLGRRRVSLWLRMRRIVHESAPEVLADSARPIGLPVGHVLHPGPGWVRKRVLGGAVDLGLGLLLPSRAAPDGAAATAVEPLPQSVLVAAGVDGAPWWPHCREYLEAMGLIAGHRAVRDGGGVLRPVGDCDVVTLLGSRVLRKALCPGLTRMRTAAVPMRRRGWLDLARIDPAFAMAAAAATDECERGFDSPVLVTADEVKVAPAGGQPAEIVLRDAAVTQPWIRGMPYL